MKIILNKNLFWFLEPNTEIDLSDPASFEMYIQQVISRGRTEDVRLMLKQVDREQFKSTFSRIKLFVPKEVRNFWEDFLENN